MSTNKFRFHIRAKRDETRQDDPISLLFKSDQDGVFLSMHGNRQVIFDLLDSAKYAVSRVKDGEFFTTEFDYDEFHLCNISSSAFEEEPHQTKREFHHATNDQILDIIDEPERATASRSPSPSPPLAIKKISSRFPSPSPPLAKKKISSRSSSPKRESSPKHRASTPLKKRSLSPLRPVSSNPPPNMAPPPLNGKKSSSMENMNKPPTAVYPIWKRQEARSRSPRRGSSSKRRLSPLPPASSLAPLYNGNHFQEERGRRRPLTSSSGYSNEYQCDTYIPPLRPRRDSVRSPSPPQPKKCFPSRSFPFKDQQPTKRRRSPSPIKNGERNKKRQQMETTVMVIRGIPTIVPISSSPSFTHKETILYDHLGKPISKRFKHEQ